MFKRFLSIIAGGLASTVGTYFLTVLLTHLLSISDYGVMARWLTDISYVSVFFTLGLNTSMMYFVREGVDMSRSIAVNVAVYSIILAFLILGLVVVPDAWKIYLFSLYIVVYCFCLNEVLRSFYQYEKRFGIFNFMVVFTPLLLLVVFFVLFCIRGVLSQNQAFIFYAIAMVASTVVYASIYYSGGNRVGRPRLPISFKSYMGYGTKSILNKLLSLSLYALSIYMISWVGEKVYVAYFFVANTISKMVWVLPDSAGNILYPSFLRTHDDESRQGVLSSMYTYAQLVFLGNIVAFLAFYLLGRWLIQLLYTPAYEVAFIPTLILLIGNQGMVYYKLFSRWYASQNQWHYIYVATLLGIVFNVLLNLILIPRYGVLGAAIGTAVSFWVCGLFISLPMRGAFLEFLNLFSLWRARKVLFTKQLL